MKKRVAIIIATYQAKKFLPTCLSSLIKLNYPADQFKIIITDDGSTDGTVEWVKQNFPEIECLTHRNLGFAGNNNIGLRWALERKFDYLYLLNQDTVVEPDFLVEAVAVLESSAEIGAVQSRLMLWPEKEKFNSLGNEIHYLGFGFTSGYQKKISDWPSPIQDYEIAYPSGAASLWRASGLEEIGLFDEEFYMYHEDLDLGWRLRLAGYKIFLASRSVVYHQYEFSRSIKKFYYMERNRQLVLLQNYKLATLALIFLPALIMNLGMFFYSFWAGWWRENLGVYEYFLQAKNWAKLIKTRKRVQAKRKVGEGEVIKFFTGKIEFQDIDNLILKYLVNPVFNLYWQIVKRIIWW